MGLETRKKGEVIMADIYNMVNEITMKVQETQEAFIFSTLSKYAMDNFQIVVEKEELARAYRRGLQDGIDKEHKRIMNILEGEKKWEKS